MDASTNREHFRSLFEAHFHEISAYCLRRLSTADANDAVSEVFVTVWRRIEELPQPDSVRLWLFGVARNAVRNRNRSLRRSQRLYARLNSYRPVGDAGPETQVLMAAEHASVIEALEMLPDDDREVVRLRLWEEMSVAETAAILDITAKAVSKRYSRALQKLERALAATVAAPIGGDDTVQGGDR